MSIDDLPAGAGRRSIFPYPGGKSTIAPWIVEHLPDHHCYVEVFGGSAAVLVTKEPSAVEVYNDLDGDLVHFFETFRDQTDDLVEYLRRTPYSREVHEKWTHAYYAGYRPDDDVERAARFFYLRFSQFASKYHGTSGFSSSVDTDKASAFSNARERLWAFADRFDGVTVERMDYGDVFDRFDGEGTVFYADPPYVDVGDEWYSHEGGFDHARFVDALGGLVGDWVVSYTDLPPGLESLAEVVVERDVTYNSQNGAGGGSKAAVERLALSFDPSERDGFVSVNQRQAALGSFGDG